MPRPDSAGAGSGWRRIPSPYAEASLWLVNAGADAMPPEAALALSDDETKRAGRFRQAGDRARFMLTRSALRHLLAEATGRAPRDLAFAAGPHGKPALAGRPDAHFNVSHSGARALIGIASRPIGVDIELMSDGSDELALAEAFFRPAEHRALEALDGAARRAAFYKIWTCKEAVLKAFGVGISARLKDFEVRLSPNRIDLCPEPNCFAPGLAAVRIATIDVSGAYAAALALA